MHVLLATRSNTHDKTINSCDFLIDRAVCSTSEPTLLYNAYGDARLSRVLAAQQQQPSSRGSRGERNPASNILSLSSSAVLYAFFFSVVCVCVCFF